MKQEEHEHKMTVAEARHAKAQDWDEQPVSEAVDQSDESTEELADSPELTPIPFEQQLIEQPFILQRTLQALLFLEPDAVTSSRLASGLGIEVRYVETALQALRITLAEQGIVLLEGGGVWRLGTHPELATAIERYYKRSRRRKLSRAMLETLAIIACQGPVTRAEIEDVRQVNSDGVVARCLELDFIEVVGQKETPGRPLLYGITEDFLRHFGLAEAGDLQALLPVEWGSLPRQTLLPLQALPAEASPEVEPVGSLDTAADS